MTRGEVSSIFIVYFYSTASFGLLMIGAATFLLLTLDHWADKAAQRGGDEGARLTRKLVRGWGISLAVGGAVAITLALWLALNR
jgi:hypothetical protein